MFSAQKKIYFSFGGVLVILVLFVWLAYLPLIRRIKNLSQEYLDNQRVLSQLDQGRISFKELDREYSHDKDNLDLINNVFLKEDDAVDFIKTLEDLTQETGNTYEIKTVSSEDSSLMLRFSLLGDFSNILLFLAHLENTPYPPYRLIKVDNFSIDQMEESLEAIVGVKIYTQ